MIREFTFASAEWIPRIIVTREYQKEKAVLVITERDGTFGYLYVRHTHGYIWPGVGRGRKDWIDEIVFLITRRNETFRRADASCMFPVSDAIIRPLYHVSGISIFLSRVTVELIAEHNNSGFHREIFRETEMKAGIQTKAA